MNLYRGLADIPANIPAPVVAIGVFDGVHLGHQYLIKKAIAKARAIRGRAIVMTFDPHPVQVLRPENNLPLITSLPLRIKLLSELGVSSVIVVPFTKAFSRLSPEMFIRKYLVGKLSPKWIYVGDDFRFGQNRQGTIDAFKEFGQKWNFKVAGIGLKRKGKHKFSSTLVRDLIARGQLSEASRILGRPVSLMGRVIPGDRRGRILGFPTANINPSREIVPPQGVYVVSVIIADKLYRGMANVGYRLSFHRAEQLLVEVHLFRFQKNIYGQEIIVQFHHKIRDELYFPSSEALLSQLRKDKIVSQKWFLRHSRQLS